MKGESTDGVTKGDNAQGENPGKWLVDRPANQDVEKHSEQDDGYGRRNGNQNNLAAFTWDREGCWKTERNN